MLHNCTTADCPLCCLLTSWYELARELMSFFAPLHAVPATDMTAEDDSCNDLIMAFNSQAAALVADKRAGGGGGGGDGKSEEVETSGHDLKMFSTTALTAAASQVRR